MRLPSDSVLTLFARDLKPVKYSHRGRGTWQGFDLEFVAQIDGPTSIVLDCRWSVSLAGPQELSPDIRDPIDRWVQSWVGIPAAFPTDVHLVPWQDYEH